MLKSVKNIKKKKKKIPNFGLSLTRQSSVLIVDMV